MTEPPSPQRRRCRRAPLCIAAAALAFAPGARAAQAASVAPSPVGDAVLAGAFQMTGRITAARRVPTEHVGDVLSRRWTFASQGCTGSVCTIVQLQREREGGVIEAVTLRRIAAGRYAGRGAFRVPLLCRKRLYPRGSYVPFRISVEITGVQAIAGAPYATAISARYRNRLRSDATPCPLGPVHDAASFSGTLVSALPAVAAAARTR